MQLHSNKQQAACQEQFLRWYKAALKEPTLDNQKIVNCMHVAITCQLVEQTLSCNSMPGSMQETAPKKSSSKELTLHGTSQTIDNIYGQTFK